MLGTMFPVFALVVIRMFIRFPASGLLVDDHSLALSVLLLLTLRGHPIVGIDACHTRIRPLSV